MARREATKCPSTEREVRVEVRAGNTVKEVRYILPDPRPYDRHEQLKQAKLEQRRNKRGQVSSIS